MRPSKYDDRPKTPKLAVLGPLVWLAAIALSTGAGLVIMTAIVLFCSGGCTALSNGQTAVDWKQANAVLLEADRTAADFQAIYQGDKLGEQIGHIREIAAPTLSAVAARAASDTAPDPTADIWTVVDTAQAYVNQIPDVNKRRRGLAVVASVRLALHLSGLQYPQLPASTKPPT